MSCQEKVYHQINAFQLLTKKEKNWTYIITLDMKFQFPWILHSFYDARTPGHFCPSSFSSFSSSPCDLPFRLTFHRYLHPTQGSIISLNLARKKMSSWLSHSRPGSHRARSKLSENDDPNALKAITSDSLPMDG